MNSEPDTERTIWTLKDRGVDVPERLFVAVHLGEVEWGKRVFKAPTDSGVNDPPYIREDLVRALVDAGNRMKDDPAALDDWNRAVEAVEAAAED